MSKLRNVRRRQWGRMFRHHMALSRRSNPLLMVDEAGSYLGWPLVLSPGHNRMVRRESHRRWANYRNTRRRGTDAQAAG